MYCSISAPVLILMSILELALAVCPRFPEISLSKNIHISIIGNPKKFVPSSVYTVQLESQPFTEFILTCESSLNEGSFQILNDGKASFAEDCLNTIIEANRQEKKFVKVLWTAPDSGCVNLKSAVKSGGIWKTSIKYICALNDGKITTSPTPTCCACDHAKYKVIFHGIWSPETHPKDFPTDLWLTHFSDVIGASHNPSFSMWAEDQLASYGFKQLAEFGVVREMETELRNQSTQLRSIIKAAGLWHPNLNGNTTAVFRVDPRRHLLSLTSMFGPSPDWIVGVSALNLCLANCSWVDDMVVDLYPYDAGTDNGITYMSVNSPTDPPEKISRITAMYPEDPRSPFYDPSGQSFQPLAKLYVMRESIIPKLCSDLTEAEILEQVSLSENTEEEVRAECSVTPYSQWSTCSVTCGKGIRMRSREYIMPEKSKLFGCDRQLVSKEMCVADAPLCPGEAEDEEVAPLAATGECEVSAWSDWSDCSVTCGIGFIVRTRAFTASNGLVHKKCMHISTMEKEKCMLPPCVSQELQVPPSCEVTEWSEWSPCSVTCGKGQRVRIREFISSNPSKFCVAITQTSQTHACTHNKTCLVNIADSKTICSLERAVGPCRGKFRKWAYNMETQACEPFYYGGCRGNRNRFESLEACNSVCAVPDHAGKTSINCVVSKWSSWSSCNPCINGTKTKTRTIIIHPKHGGRDCPILSKTMKCSIPIEFCENIE